MKHTFKVRRQKFDWKALIGWIVFIRLVLKVFNK